MVSGYAIKIALAIGLAAAATVGAITLFLKEAATLSEVPQKNASGTLPTEKRSKSSPVEPFLNTVEESSGRSDPSPAAESLPDSRKAGSETKPPVTAALEPPKLLSAPSPEFGGNILQETKDVSYNINSSKSKIVDNLSSPRVKITKESVNKIFNTGIRESFSKSSDPKFKFEGSSGDLKFERKYVQPKTTGRTVNLYKIGAALGGETYLCISAAKLHCVETGQTDQACEHPQKAVLQNCVDKAMESADPLISSQLKQEAG
jgi:hypothetical protein